MKVLRQAAVYGLTIGTYAIVGVYLMLTLLPSGEWMIPILAIAIPAALFWPTRFYANSRRWIGRFGRRMGVVGLAMPVAALTAAFIVWMMPAYSTWLDDAHRHMLQARGLPADKIDAGVAAHHQTLTDFSSAGASAALGPGLIGALLTASIGTSVRRGTESPTPS